MFIEKKLFWLVRLIFVILMFLAFVLYIWQNSLIVNLHDLKCKKGVLRELPQYIKGGIEKSDRVLLKLKDNEHVFTIDGCAFRQADISSLLKLHIGDSLKFWIKADNKSFLEEILYRFLNIQVTIYQASSKSQTYLSVNQYNNCREKEWYIVLIAGIVIIYFLFKMKSGIGRQW